MFLCFLFGMDHYIICHLFWYLLGRKIEVIGLNFFYFNFVSFDIFMHEAGNIKIES
jgi:hypothetical protein